VLSVTPRRRRRRRRREFNPRSKEASQIAFALRRADCARSFATCFHLTRSGEAQSHLLAMYPQDGSAAHAVRQLNHGHGLTPVSLYALTIAFNQTPLSTRQRVGRAS